MRTVQRYEATSCVSVVRRCASRLRGDETVAMIEKVPAIGTVCFAPAPSVRRSLQIWAAAALGQQGMVSASQQHAI